MLSCLDNIVGIQSCPNADNCELMINSLPGITLESIVAATEQEKIVYINAWDDIVQESKSTFRVDVIEKIIECRQPTVECNYDDVICGNKKILTNAWKYKLAITLLEFRIYSTRINRFTLFGKEEAHELRKHYLQKYQDALRQAMLFIDFEKYCCAPCKGGNPSSVIFLP